MLGIRPHQAEDALHSERAARAVLSRRDLFAAGSAMAVGSVFSFAKPAQALSPYLCFLLEAYVEGIVQSQRTMASWLGAPFTWRDGTEAAFRERVRGQLTAAALGVLKA